MTLERIRSAAQAATPGPWRADPEWSGWDGACVLGGGEPGDINEGSVAFAFRGTGDEPIDLANARYIALLDPTTVLALVACAEAAQRALVELEARAPHDLICGQVIEHREDPTEYMGCACGLLDVTQALREALASLAR